MLKIKDYLEEKHISLYKIAKDAGIAYPTVFNIVNGKIDINSCTYGIVKKIAKALDMTTDDFAGLCHPMEWFYVFRSEQWHLVQRKGALQYIIDVLENDIISKLWEEDKKKALYVLAMTDYLSRKNGLPKCTKYEKFRNYALKNPLYPTDIELEDKISHSNKTKERFEKKAIPEFYRFNIIEGDVYE